MPRRIILENSAESPEQLLEVLADNEAELQNFLKDNPDLFPVEEIGLTDTIMITGRESTVPSGSIDLVAIARSGSVLIVEFKTGPGNPDFRHVLAQLFDYGSHIWGMSYEQFESESLKFFASDRCTDSRLKSMPSLAEAAAATWRDFSEEESDQFQSVLSSNLSTGNFFYIVAAQDFTPQIQQTVEYLNAVMDGPRFFGVEVIKFQGHAMTAFEARTVLKPSIKSTRQSPVQATEGNFLDHLEDVAYQEVLKGLFDLFRDLGLRFEWGSIGTSVRVLIPGSPVLLTLGWFFPPGRTGWMGMTDVTLGYPQESQALTDDVRKVLETYVDNLSHLSGGQAETRGNSNAYRFDPKSVVDYSSEIETIFRQLVSKLNVSGD
ncbi:MAG: hypothetical protein QGG39_15870 [Candidatus Poribacteria bacterium]|nr:hypothetical protein [Candidatus Poribacteria bacterium]